MNYPFIPCLLVISIAAYQTHSVEVFLDNGIEGFHVIQNVSDTVANTISELSSTLVLIEYQHLADINDKTINQRCILSCLGRRRRKRRSLEMPSRLFQCLGNLIAPNFILTAASCVTFTGNFLPISVRLADGRDFEIDQITVPEDYRVNISENSLGNKAKNIALIKLKQDVVFNSQVSPVCLTDAKDKNLASDLVTIEWQMTKEVLKGNLNSDDDPQSTRLCEHKYGFELTPAHVYARGPLTAESCGVWTAGRRKLTTGFKYLVSLKTKGASCDTRHAEIETAISDHMAWIRDKIEMN